MTARISCYTLSRMAEPALLLSKLGVEHDTNSRIRLKTKVVVSSGRIWDSTHLLSLSVSSICLLSLLLSVGGLTSGMLCV